MHWGFYHLQEDERIEEKKFETLLETMTALLNPEAYKKFKNSKKENNTYISDTFIKTVMKNTGMTEKEAGEFMSTKTDTIENESFDVILDPILL